MLPRWDSGKETACQCRRPRKRGFNPWVRKIPLEEEMTTHSSILAWRISWTEEPGRLQSMGLQRVEHGWAWKLRVDEKVGVRNLLIQFFPVWVKPGWWLVVLSLEHSFPLHHWRNYAAVLIFQLFLIKLNENLETGSEWTYIVSKQVLLQATLGEWNLLIACLHAFISFLTQRRTYLEPLTKQKICSNLCLAPCPL